MMAERGFRFNKDLAEAAGLPAWRVGEFVKGTPKRLDLGTLDKLCRALDCQPGDLLVYLE